MKELNLELSKWIKSLRKRAGLSIPDASLRLKLSTRELERLESGSSIRLSLISEMVQVYAIDPDELVETICRLQIRFLPRGTIRPLHP